LPCKGRIDIAGENGRRACRTARFSVIVVVYNDWAPLEQCLQSLAQQNNAPEFEVIVVDDGSDDAAPDAIRKWSCCYPLIIARQPHAGIPTARNHGIRISRGSVLVFTDGDCRLEGNCLELLSAAIARSPLHDCFQLHLVGDGSNIIGRAEELRLNTIQKRMLEPKGGIRYLNTAGFAIRRARVDIENGLFDPAALRAEDTLLLANLIRNRKLPLFVTNAIIQHAISLSLIQCLRKDVRSACIEAETFLMIASIGVRIRVSHRERLRILWYAWRASRHGRSAWFVLICRQALRRTIGSAYECFLQRSFRTRRRDPAPLNIHLDQHRSVACETFAKRTSKRIDGRCTASRYPHASCQENPVEVRTPNLEHA
jgi:glycosyltransferase involved in cell wall biosynthesis